jgi:hypothetical protein
MNFVFEDSVEHRVQEVLEEKLAIIFEEFGIDKTGDVLDSAQAGQIFDDLYVGAILNPHDMGASVEKAINRIQEQAREAQKNSSALGATEDLEPSEAERLMSHPLPHWVERMTVSYLKAHGGKAELDGHTWNLTWPTAKIQEKVVFTGKEAERLPGAKHLTLEEPRVRDLVLQIPSLVPGQPIPVVSIYSLSNEVEGTWALFRIAIVANNWNRHRIMPLFLADTGMLYMQTARHIWDYLVGEEPIIQFYLDIQESQVLFSKIQKVAEEQGRPVYEELLQEHREYIFREREKADYTFTARRRIIERIGLPQVRNHRLNLISQEEKLLQEQLDQKAQVLPEMAPLILMRVQSDGKN